MVQAGVRYAATNPLSYVDSNIKASVSLFEAMRRARLVPALIYASSSSVYGLTKNIPFNEDEVINQPTSLYAASKAAVELTAHVYYHLYGINTIGLRLFTVYGPWGRPDMSYMMFARSILQQQPIRVFRAAGGLELARDFTFVDDIVRGVQGAVELADADAAGGSGPHYRIFNLGNSRPETVTRFVTELAAQLGHPVILNYTELPKLGEVLRTHSNIGAAAAALKYAPRTSLEDGLRQFSQWYYGYYGPGGLDSPRTKASADELEYKPV